MLKWGSFGFWCRQWTTTEKKSPTSGSGRGAPPPLDLSILRFGSRGGNDGNWIRINNFLPFFILLLGFWFKVRACIWFKSPHLGNQRSTLTCVVSGALMELTPLSHVLLWLCGVVLCLWLWQVVLSRHALALSFFLWFWNTLHLLLIRRSKVSLLLFEFLLNLGSIPVCRTKRGDVEELHFLLNVYV